jgi:hypothetical protein
MNVREEFLSNYMVHLKGALPRELCEDWVQDYFVRTGIDESDPSTLSQEASRFSERTRTLSMAEASPLTWEVICELLGGEDKIDERTRYFSNNFNLNINSGADKPWQGPSAASPGWHKDGWFFRHFLDSPEQALLCLVIWRDIKAQSGGTFYAPDSVPPICRELLAHPEGLSHRHAFGQFIHECTDFREMIAETGDVIILHPFVLHASSQNPSGRIRFMNNKVISLNQPMQFNRPDGAYTALEASILQALEVDSLDFHITGQRLCSGDFSQLKEEEVVA